MTVREDREVSGPPAMILAAVATAAENLGYTVLDVRPDEGLAIATTPLTVSRVTLGYIVTARVRERPNGSLLSVDVTPRLGSWARQGAQDTLDELVREFQAVVQAPKARVRSPDTARSGERPFGFWPEILALAWAVLSIGTYGLLIGSWGWIPAAAGGLGALMVARPTVDEWWSWVITGLAFLSLPFGILGALARRMLVATQLWVEMEKA